MCLKFMGAISAFCMLCLPAYALAQSATTTDAASTSTATTATTTSPTTTPVTPPTNVDVEAKVRAYFADVPIMAAIAKCESEFRQYSGSGSLHGGAGNAMIGVFQIHSGVHQDFAKTKGMDIETLDGNLAYARYLYANEGTTPWLSSSSCWKTTSASAPGTLTLNLSIGQENAEVLTLQKMLNAAGFTLAESGPGSPGNETSRFGALTKAAVRKFQCEAKVVCEGDEGSTGFGRVGPKTRAALSQYSLARAAPNSDPASSTGAPAAPAPAIQVNVTTSSGSGSGSSSGSSSGSASASIPVEAAQVDALQKQILELQKKIAELMDT